MYVIYAGMVNQDSCEGRGPMRTIGLFERKQDALASVKGWGVMGVGDGEVEEMKVFDNVEEFREYVYAKQRKTGLDKLTVEEKIALGLLTEH